MTFKKGDIVKLVNERVGEIFIIKLTRIYNITSFSFLVLKVVKKDVNAYISTFEVSHSIKDDKLYELTNKEKEDLMIALL